MKILHTADWHLGKKLDFYSRMEEQIRVMDEICQIAEQQQVDLVIIAGDLFDAFNPPTEAVELLYKTMKTLTNNGKRPVIAIAGNHDSPSLIDAPNPLARACGIVMIGYPNAIVSPFKLPDFEILNAVPGFIEIQLKHIAYPVRIIHTSYANELRLKAYLGEENREDALADVLRQNWQNLAETYCDAQGVNLLTAHLYMMRRGGEIPEEPEGEKPIRVGNADLIYSDIIPPQIQYTALGHLHGYRNVGTAERPAVYASSPLAYSFSEAGQQKFVSIVQVERGENAHLEKIELKNGRALARKSFDNVDFAVKWLEEHPDLLVELTMESEYFLTAEERRKIMQSHSGIIHLIPKVKNTGGNLQEIKEINLDKGLEELFIDYFKTKNDGQEPNEELMNLLKEVLAFSN
ncbi:MAG: exonuclease subunit SbcD [Weeksellaceae bacterium]